MDGEGASTSVDFQVLLPAHEAALARVLHEHCLKQGLKLEVSRNPTLIAWKIPGCTSVYYSDAAGFAIDVSQCKLNAAPSFVALWDEAKSRAAGLGCSVHKTWLRSNGVHRAWKHEDMEQFFDGVSPLLQYIRRVKCGDPDDR